VRFPEKLHVALASVGVIPHTSPSGQFLYVCIGMLHWYMSCIYGWPAGWLANLKRESGLGLTHLLENEG